MAVLTQAPAPVRPWPALIAAYAGVFLTISDLFKVLVAVPGIQRALHAPPSVGQWILAGFQLTYAVTLVTGGRLGDRYGRRRVFCAGVALFTVASVASGLAPGAGFLIAARLVQGLGAALALPQAFSLVQVLFPPERRDRPFAVMGAVLGVSSVTGQVVGGVILQVLPWRAVFLVNAPAGLVIFVAALRLIPDGSARDVAPAESGRVDRPGTALLSGALVLLVLPLIEGRQLGWPAWTWLCLAAAPLAFAAFALVERRVPAAGRLAPVLGRGLLLTGAVVAAGGFAALLATPLTTSFIVTATVVLGFGMGLVQTPLLNVALKGVREEHVGTASGVLSTAQQVGGSMGVALVGVVYFHAVPDGRGAAFTAGCVFGLALVLLSLALLAALARPASAAGRAASGPRRG